MSDKPKLPLSLTEAQMAALAKGFLGPRPGSNFFPFIALGCADDRDIDGEDIERMVRDGILAARPTNEPVVLRGNPSRDIPDVELTHAYRLASPDGALSSHQERMEQAGM